ncbi:hypothetical protein V6Z12_D10G170500 [Gossypium hirsutum]
MASDFMRALKRNVPFGSRIYDVPAKVFNFLHYPKKKKKLKVWMPFLNGRSHVFFLFSISDFASLPGPMSHVPTSVSSSGYYSYLYFLTFHTHSTQMHLTLVFSLFLQTHFKSPFIF